MTTEEKARAYDEALKRAKAAIDIAADKDLVGGVVRTIFPELRESEDERIREEAISIVQSYMNICDEEGDPCLSGYKVLAWLEKQKEQKPLETPSPSVIYTEQGDVLAEQKPAEWNDADMREARNNLISVCRDWERGEKTTLIPLGAVRARYFLEHLEEGFKTCRESGLRDGQKYVLDNAESYGLCKPAEWSEEDEEMLNRIINDYENGDEYWFKAQCSTPFRPKINWLKSLRPQLKQGGVYGPTKTRTETALID